MKIPRYDVLARIAKHNNVYEIEHKIEHNYEGEWCKAEDVAKLEAKFDRIAGELRCYIADYHTDAEAVEICKKFNI